MVCNVLVSCKANEDRNQLGAWLDSDPIILISLVTSDGSEDTVYLHSLIKAFTAYIHKVGALRLSPTFWPIDPLNSCACMLKRMTCIFLCIQLKPALSGHSKIYKTKILMTNGRLMKVESIAECSH